MYESPNLFGGNMWTQTPGTQRVNADKLTWDMHQPGSGGGVGGIAGGIKGATQPLVPGGMAGLPPKRMKKMPKN